MEESKLDVESPERYAMETFRRTWRNRIVGVAVRKDAGSTRWQVELSMADESGGDWMTVELSSADAVDIAARLDAATSVSESLNALRL